MNFYFQHYEVKNQTDDNSSFILLNFFTGQSPFDDTFAGSLILTPDEFNAFRDYLKDSGIKFHG